MSLARVKKASSTFIDALALVSRNFIPYSTANCSPLSLDTWQWQQKTRLAIKTQKVQFVRWTKCCAFCALRLSTRIVFATSHAYLSLFIQFTLVAQKHFFYVRSGVLFNIPNPVLDVFKAFFICDVVYEHNAHGSSIIRGCDGPEPLLTSSVPEKPHNCLTTALLELLFILIETAPTRSVT